MQHKWCCLGVTGSNPPMGCAVQIVAHYNKYFVKQQLVAVCEDFMKVVRGVALPIEERSLLKTARAAGCGRTFRPKSEAMVFYKKHIADVCRYKAEVAETKEELEEAAEAAEAMYLQAKKNAEALFRPTHPLYLGLLLNMAGSVSGAVRVGRPPLCLFTTCLCGPYVCVVVTFSLLP